MRIKHIGLLKPHPDKVNELIEAVRELRVFSIGLPNVVSFTHGPYDSQEGLNQGFTYIFEVVFSSKKARDEYLDNETHKNIAGKIIGNLENPNDFKTYVAVVDFEDKFLTIRSLCDFVEQFITENTAKIKARDKETLDILEFSREQLINANKKDKPVFNKIIDLSLFNTQNRLFEIDRENIIRGRIAKMIQKIDTILAEESNAPTCTIL